MSTSDLEKVLFTRSDIDDIVQKVAANIDKVYAPIMDKNEGGKLVLIGVLKGSYMFLSDLSRHVKTPHTIDFISVSSYSDTKSTGTVKIQKDLKESITGDYAIIVEDILDSGLTLSYLLKLMEDKKPKCLEVCTLLRKPTEAKVDITVHYLGVDIDPEFVVGYGLDYNEWFRNLDCIGIPTVEAIEKYKIN